jgi:hypothetical protein
MQSETNDDEKKRVKIQSVLRILLHGGRICTKDGVYSLSDDMTFCVVLRRQSAADYINGVLPTTEDEVLGALGWNFGDVMRWAADLPEEDLLEPRANLALQKIHEDAWGRKKYTKKFGGPDEFV